MSNILVKEKGNNLGFMAGKSTLEGLPGDKSEERTGRNKERDMS